MFLDGLDRAGKPRQDPAILDGEIAWLQGRVGSVGQIHEGKAHSVQQLVAEIAPCLEALAHQLGRRHLGHGAENVKLLARGRTEVGEDALSVLRRGQVDKVAGVRRDRLHRQPDVLHARLHVAQHVTHGVSTVALDDVHRVDAVALGLAHPLALAVQDVGVDEYIGERHVAHVVKAHNHHTGHPQGNDVAPRDETGSRVVIRQGVGETVAAAHGRLAGGNLGGLRVGPAEGALRP